MYINVILIQDDMYIGSSLAGAGELGPVAVAATGCAGRGRSMPATVLCAEVILIFQKIHIRRYELQLQGSCPKARLVSMIAEDREARCQQIEANCLRRETELSESC